MSDVANHLDSRFENSGRTLVLTADIVKGWRKEQRGPEGEALKTYCLSEVADAEWQGGKIRAQLSVFPRPGGVTEEWATPPTLDLAGSRAPALIHVRDASTGKFESVGMIDDCCVIRASAGTIVATIALLDESGKKPRRFWVRPNVGGHQMFERQYDHAVRGRAFKVQIQLRLTFRPPQTPAPVERSFWNRFLPGGRPESNRRKF